MRVLALFLIILLIYPTVSVAVSITEIMYDYPGSDKGHEWIEIKTDECINLTEWKFYEQETNHRIKFFSGNETVCDFAIIARNSTQFLIDFPDFKGNLFNASFSLKNSGEEIAIKNPDGKIVDSVYYSSEWGGNGNGNTIQLLNDSWIEHSPTPGYQPEIEENQNIENSTENYTENVTGENDNIFQEELENESKQKIEKSLEIINIPNKVSFGSEFKIKIEFCSDKDYEDLKAIAYLYKPKWICEDSKGTVRVRPWESDKALDISIGKGICIYIDLPLKIKDNCDSSYPNGRYKGKIRIYNSGDVLIEKNFGIGVEDQDCENETEEHIEIENKTDIIPKENANITKTEKVGKNSITGGIIRKSSNGISSWFKEILNSILDFFSNILP